MKIEKQKLLTAFCLVLAICLLACPSQKDNSEADKGKAVVQPVALTTANISMSFAGLFAWHDDGTTVTAYAVDGDYTPLFVKDGDMPPTIKYVEAADYPPHKIRFEIVTGSVVETDVNSTVVWSCTTPGAGSSGRRCLLDDPILDDDGFYQRNGYMTFSLTSGAANRPATVELAKLLSATTLANNCKYLDSGSYTHPSDGHFKENNAKDKAGAFIVLDRGTSIVAKYFDCPGGMPPQVFNLTNSDGKFCGPTSTTKYKGNLAEVVDYEWTAAPSPLVLEDKERKHKWTISPINGKIVLDFRNDLPNHPHPQPFRWLYHLTTRYNDTASLAKKHHLYPAVETGCGQLGDRCPMVKLN